MSLNKKEKTIKLVSLGRATGVPIPGRNDDLLTHTFPAWRGGDQLAETVQDCFKVDVEKYIRVNLSYPLSS
ncbi:MAG: LCP family protein [Clostridia bacterium]